MPEPLIRIFSDIHYGDRASKVRSLDQLDPLLDGPSTVVLNGDTFDTRQSPRPEHTAAQRAQVESYFSRAKPRIVMMTGNHDPDLTAIHSLDLADGQVFVTHGDILFENIVPWSTEAKHLLAEVTAGRALMTAEENRALEPQLALFRRVCAGLPQRHQAEHSIWRYLVSYLNDTIWPPTRVFSILHAWHRAPKLAAELIRQHRPKAKFILLGHFHRAGVWAKADGRVAINTGAFCTPFNARVVELTPGKLTVRRVEPRAGQFHPGPIVAEFALAAPAISPTTTS